MPHAAVLVLARPRAGALRGGGQPHPLMATTPIHDPEDFAPSARPRRDRDRRGLLLGIDPVLLLAVIGLGVCSVAAINGTTESQLASRQRAYFAIGLVLLLVASQV